MEEVQGVKWCVGWEMGFIFERGKIYQCCVKPVLLYYCETWELTVADKVSLHRVECCMIRMMCEVRQVDRVSTEVLHDRVGVLL